MGRPRRFGSEEEEWVRDVESVDWTYARLGSCTAFGVDPDVLSHDHALLIELEELLESFRP